MADDKLSITFSGSAAKLVGELNKLAIAANKSATKIDAAANKANAAMAKLGTSLGTNFTNTLKSAGTAVMRFSMILGGAFVAAAGAATREINKFNEALTEIGTLGVPTEDIERYRDALLDISAGTSESLVNLTEGLYQTISAGVTDATEALKLLDVAQKAAIGGATDTATAVDALTIVFNSYSSELKTSEERLALVTRIGDTLNRTVDLGRTKFGELAASIGMVAGTAASAGLTIEEMTGTIAVLTRTLPNTAVATTALNNLLIKLVAPGDAAKEMAAELGIELGEAALKADGFAAKIAEIIEKTGGSQEKMKALVEDTRALRAMTSIAGQGVDALTTAIAAMGGAAGSVDDDFKKMSETISFRLGRLRNVFVTSFEEGVTGSSAAIKDALEEIEGFFKEHGKGIVDTLTNVLMGFGKFVKFLVDNRGAIVAVLTAIFAASTFKFFIGGIVAAQQAFVNFGTALKTSGAAGAANIGKITEAANKSKDSFAGAASGAAKIGVALMVIIPIMQKLSDAFHQFDRDMTVAFQDWVRGVEAGTLEAVTERDRILAEAAERERERRATLLDELSRMEYDAALEAAHAKLRAEDFAVTGLIAKRMALHEQLRKLREDSEARINDAMRRGGPERAAAVKREIELEEKRLNAMVTSVNAEMNERKATATEIGEFIAILYEDQTAKFIEESGKREEVAKAEAELMGVAVAHINARVVGAMAVALKKLREEAKKARKVIEEELNPRNWFKENLERGVGGGLRDIVGNELSAGVEQADIAEHISDAIEDGGIQSFPMWKEMVYSAVTEGFKNAQGFFSMAILGEKFEEVVVDSTQAGMERGAHGALQSVEGIYAEASESGTRQGVKKGTEEGVEEGLKKAEGRPSTSFVENLSNEVADGTSEGLADAFDNGEVKGTQVFNAIAETAIKGGIGNALGQAAGFFRDKLIDSVTEAKGPVAGLLVATGFKFVDAVGKGLIALAKKFSKAVMGAVKAAGNFLLDVFVRGPIREFMNLLTMARTTSAGLDAKEAGETFAAAMDEKLQGFLDNLQNLVDNLPTLMRRVAEFVPEIVDAVIEAIPQIVDAAIEGAGPLTDAVIDAIPRVIDALVAQIEPFIASLEETLPRLIRGIVEGIVQIVMALLDSDIGPRIWTLIMDILGDVLPLLIDLVSDIVADFMQNIGGVISDLVGMIVGDLIPAILREIPEIIMSFVENIGPLIQGLVGGISSELIAAVPDIIMAFIDGFITTGGGFKVAWEIVKGLVLGIGYAIRDIAIAIANAIRDAFSIGGGRRTEEGTVITGTGLVVGEDGGGSGNIETPPTDWNPFPGPNAPEAHTGGLISLAGVQRFQFGGIVNAINRGMARAAADNVPILAQAGEFVMSRNATAREGPAAMAAVNEGSASIGGGEQVHYHFHAGSSVLVDSVRNLDSQMSELMDGGAGKTAATMRKRSDPPIRKGQRFNQES